MLNSLVRECNKCGVTKPLEDFYKYKNGPQGRGFACKGCVNKRRREDPKQAKNKQDYLLFCRYGITLEEYEEMAVEQGGVCAICNESPSSRLFVDHNHITGRVRALLCSHCNLAIGLFKENPDIFLSAMMYLRKYLGRSWSHVSYLDDV